MADECGYPSRPYAWTVVAILIATTVFLNAAVGASAGPSAATATSADLFGANTGLGPALTLTVASGCALAAATLVAALSFFKAKSATPTPLG